MLNTPELLEIGVKYPPKFWKIEEECQKLSKKVGEIRVEKLKKKNVLFF